MRVADVAKAAGVGTSIASRVLNGDPTVSIRPETRERILNAADELKYRPNAFARGLKLARTTSLGLVVNLAYYAENIAILQGVERRAADSGYVTLVADASEFADRGDAYGRLLYERRVDGLLIATALISDELIRELEGERLPFVPVNRRVRGVGPSVTCDDAKAVGLIVEHLTSLGHRRIGYIAGPLTADVVQRRVAGFKTEMEETGLDVPEELVVGSSLEHEAGFDAMKRLLSLDPRPTAVAIWSPTAAIAALAAARGQGLKLPDELSVIAYSDADIAAYLDPPLTTVRTPFREMAATGVECLLGLIEGDRQRSVVVPTSPMLVDRGSTCAPAS